MSTYVMSDVHGYPLEKIQALLKKADFDSNDVCYILGDVIDRGEDAVDLLLWLIDSDNVKFILGNHEAMMLSCSFIFDEITEKTISNFSEMDFQLYQHWIDNGATKTLIGLKKISHSQQQRILEFLKAAPLYEKLTISNKTFYLTHSGLGNFSKEKSIEDYSAEELLWNRTAITDTYYDDAITVFGHTPTFTYADKYQGKPIITDTFINIDVGVTCGYSPLLLRLDDMQQFYLD